MSYKDFTIKKTQDVFQIENEGNTKNNIYGVITSGSIWRFLKLVNNAVHIDLDDYGIKELGKIMGILSGMVEQRA